MSPLLTEPGTASSAPSPPPRETRAPSPRALLALPGGLTGSGYDEPVVLAEAVTAAHLARSLPADPAPGAEALEPAETIGELRELTELTWDETARLFGVSRRTVHYWASGHTAMTAARQRRLNQVIEVITNFGAAPTRMQAALRSSVDGRSIIEIIAMGAPPGLIRAHLASRLGPGRRRRTAPVPPLELLPEQPRDHRRVSARSRLVPGAAPVFDPEEPARP